MSDNTSYRVVVNGQEQYSLWPSAKELPPGWSDTGMSGAMDDCLAYVGEVWTDMRPLTVRGSSTAAGPRQ